MTSHQIKSVIICLRLVDSETFECKFLNIFSLQCFVFHLYKGVRAGGGIGDEIESPDGDEYEIYRIVFDITFFFFVIVILLAIIQGNICLSLSVLLIIEN